jgi:hypothetical protein
MGIEMRLGFNNKQRATPEEDPFPIPRTISYFAISMYRHDIDRTCKGFDYAESKAIAPTVLTSNKDQSKYTQSKSR